jgi:hypothetical protein
VTGPASGDERGGGTGVDVPTAVGAEDIVADSARIRLTITTPRVSDTEVAAITVALLAATSGAPAAGAPPGPPAWRHAGLLEAATDRRVRTPAELRPPA